MKTGLILEGGGMRGMFSAGVTDVLMEAGIVFDGAIGVSAGAAFGCNYKSGQIGRAFRYNVKYCSDRRYSGLRVLLKEGNLFSTDFCYDELPRKLDPFDFEAYWANPMEFYVVCTDVDTGKPVYHLYECKDRSLDWIRASASMPLVSQFVELDGKKLLDGGISDSIPVKYFQRIGYEKNLVILTQPEGYRKKKNALMPMMRVKYRRYPNMLATMANRHNAYNETLSYIARQEQEGRLLVIRPAEDLGISRAEKDPEKLRAAYEKGREMGQRMLPEIRAFLAEENCL